MPSPQNGYTQFAVTDVSNTGTNYIDAILSGYKWGGAVGTGASLTYSFPWSTSSTAYWATNPSYDSRNEPSSGYALTSSQQSAFRSALAAWANVANLTFTEVSESSSSVGVIRIAWTTKSNGSSSGWAWYPDDYYATGGDIWLSQSSIGSQPASSWQPSGFCYSVLLHELGHALGLKHSFEDSPILPASQESTQYTVMSYTDHPHNIFLRVTPTSGGRYSFDYSYIEPDTPMLYDIAAIQRMYGANTSYHAGNDTYTFDPSTPFYRTLWDTGGTDTISVSNFSKGCTIDLVAGHFSKITIESDAIPAGYTGGTQPTYDGTDNLAIAFGAVIENAIGGSGNDTLIGNEVGNNLSGGSGGDTLTGAGGNDTIDGGDGSDTVVFTGRFSDYTITYAADTGYYTLTDKTASRDGSDQVRNVESFRFSDGTRASSALGAGTSVPGQTVSGTSANDTLRGTAGNDTINGGSGTDTVVFSGARSAYTVTKTSTGLTVTDSLGVDGSDTLSGIERLQFSDRKLAFDTSGSAASAAEIIGASFGKATLSNLTYVGIALGLFDAGQSMEQVAQLAISTGLVSAPDNTSFVRAVWLNVIGTPIDSANLAYYTSVLNNHYMTQASLLALAAQTTECQTQVNLVGLASTGLAYV